MCSQITRSETKPKIVHVINAGYPNGTRVRARVSGLMNVVEQREGQLIKVHGGRDWDGSIDAKTIWL